MATREVEMKAFSALNWTLELDGKRERETCRTLAII
jgi:hypothetical protein